MRAPSLAALACRAEPTQQTSEDVFEDVQERLLARNTSNYWLPTKALDQNEQPLGKASRHFDLASVGQGQEV